MLRILTVEDNSSRKFSRIISFTAVLMVFCIHSSAQDSAPTGEILALPNWRDSSLRVGEWTRLYRVYVPGSLPEETAVVLLLHGGRQSMRRIFSNGAVATSEWAEVAETESFLLVVPNGTNATTGDTRGDHQGWNDGRVVDSPVEGKADDVAFLTELLDRIERDYSIDGGRIYVTGASNGGMMTFRLLMEVPGTIRRGGSLHCQSARGWPCDPEAGLAYTLADRQRKQGSCRPVGGRRDFERATDSSAQQKPLLTGGWTRITPARKTPSVSTFLIRTRPIHAGSFEQPMPLRKTVPRSCSTRWRAVDMSCHPENTLFRKAFQTGLFVGMWKGQDWPGIS